MQDKDQKLIWENYHNKLQEGTDGSTSDLTDRERLKLAAAAKKQGKGPLADDKPDEQVKAEGSRRPEGPDDFKLTADELDHAESEYNGMRLSKFVNKHASDLNKQQPVVLQGWDIVKHYGKVHAQQTSKVPGDSIEDAIRGTGAISIDRAVAEEQRPGAQRAFIVSYYSNDLDEYKQTRAARGHQAKDMARWRHD